MGRNMTGAKGADVTLKVPAGTQVFDEDNETLICDLTVVGQRFLLAKGGNGGFGNQHFKTSTNQAPRRANPGLPGEELNIWLRLKLIADAGLVGLPNAGKSTFLAAVTAAKPKIADYPFTTLHPGLGVARIDAREFVIADIPGLIEGAHEGVGIGDRFLGHVERTRVLLHLVSAQEENPGKAYKTVRAELDAYGNGLTEKVEIVALSQVDTLDADARKKKVASLKRAAGRAPMLLVGRHRRRRRGGAAGADGGGGRGARRRSRPRSRRAGTNSDGHAVAEEIPAHHRQDRLGAARRPHDRPEARLAGLAGRRHCRAGPGRRRNPGRLVRRHRAWPHHSRPRQAGAEARGKPGGRRRRPDRAGRRLVGCARQGRPEIGPDPADARRHRGAPPLPQRAGDDLDAAQDEGGAGHQRERHGGDLRNPLWRQ